VVVDEASGGGGSLGSAATDTIGAPDDGLSLAEPAT
jgi:hypothetical protein